MGNSSSAAALTASVLQRRKRSLKPLPGAVLCLGHFFLSLWRAGTGTIVPLTREDAAVSGRDSRNQTGHPLLRLHGSSCYTDILKHWLTGFHTPTAGHAHHLPKAGSQNIPSYLASGKGCPGLSWWASEGRCCCCCLESWGSCWWASGETGGCWAAGRSLET